MQKPHILIVEDSPIAQMVLKQQMTDAGCIVDLASDGNSAMEQAQAIKYDIILMDIGLGDGPDGFETTQFILSNSKLNTATPIMAISANSEPDYKEKATSIGMVGYFTKPFTPAHAKAVMNFLENTKKADS